MSDRRQSELIIQLALLNNAVSIFCFLPILLHPRRTYAPLLSEYTAL